MRVDLHSHTTASDGSLRPSDLVERAAAAGINVLGLTDHDTLAGLDEATQSAARCGVRLIPGLELSVLHHGRTLHFLCYGFDALSPALDRLTSMVDSRTARARCIVEDLAALGAPVSWTRVRELAGGAIGRPHIAAALVEAGHARDIADAFDRYLGEGQAAYRDAGRLDPAEAIRFVREAGGEAALAHPLSPRSKLDLDRILPELLEAGLTGIEVYHPDHDRSATTRLERVAEDQNLWWCGGSDFHGTPKPHIALGSTLVDESVLQQGPFVSRSVVRSSAPRRHSDVT